MFKEKIIINIADFGTSYPSFYDFLEAVCHEIGHIFDFQLGKTVLYYKYDGRKLSPKKAQQLIETGYIAECNADYWADYLMYHFYHMCGKFTYSTQFGKNFYLSSIYEEMGIKE